MRATFLPALTVLLSCFTTGCVHEEWTFKVAHNVQVFASDASIRPGAVTLIPVEVAQAQVEAEAKIEAVSNATLKEKLEQRIMAERALTKLRGELGPDHPRVQDQKQVVANLEKEIAEISARASAHHALATTNTKPKTVLVITLDHVGPGPIRTSLGGDLLDRYSRILVMIIDEPLPKETIWATADNSILISYSPYTPPERTYVAVEGSVKIVSVRDGKVVADVAVQTRSDVDTTDADFFRLPWEMRGRKTFTVAEPQDPLFKTGALRWGAPRTFPTTPPVAAAAR